MNVDKMFRGEKVKEKRHKESRTRKHYVEMNHIT
jgi:hypothetical protein